MLTVKQIEYAEIKEKPYKLIDTAGLYLFITNQGRKYWRSNYRFNGKNKTISYGVFPNVTLLEARNLHTQAKDLIKSGVDPMVDKTERKIKERASRFTFAFVAEKWFEHWKHNKNAHHAANVHNYLQNEIYPAFGHKLFRDLTFGDIKKFIQSLVKLGTFEVARRALQKINHVCRYAYIHEYIDTPMVELKPSDLIPSRQVRNHHRITEVEIPQLLKDINQYDGSVITVMAIKLMALTFVRTSELIKATWTEIDFDKSLWTIPSIRMKMKRPHLVPLSKQSLKLLRELQNYSSGQSYLFPTAQRVRKGEEKSICNNTILFALYRLGYRGKMTGHGFRGLASTILHEQEYNHAHIELQLAHAEKNAISAAYNHAQYLSQRTKMMQDWADYLSSKGDI